MAMIACAITDHILPTDDHDWYYRYQWKNSHYMDALTHHDTLRQDAEPRQMVQLERWVRISMEALPNPDGFTTPESHGLQRTLQQL